MMGRLPHSTGLLLLLALIATPAQANEIVCASQSAGYLYCRADTSRGVRLEEQLGPFACNQGNTWGFDKGGVWVANGCTARFRLGPTRASDELEGKAQASGAETLARDLASGGRSVRKRAAMPSPALSPNGQNAAVNLATANKTAQQALSSQAFILVCESKQYKLQKCPVPVKAHVGLKRKLGRAECRFNASWGYNYGEIWVNDGCRAEFEVR